MRELSYYVENGIPNWLRNKKEEAKARGFIVGISGGKDSAVVAGLCVNAVGKENVFGVLMPNGKQSDIQDSLELCKHLGIEYTIINIKKAYKSIVSTTKINNKDAIVNILPRLRMTTLYALGREKNYLVVGTGNACERLIGRFTKWGDGASDLNPIGNFLVSEVIAMGDLMGLPSSVIHKTPNDGMSGKSDEEKLGISYSDIEKYILRQEISDITKQKIENMRKKTTHKLLEIDVFMP